MSLLLSNYPPAKTEHKTFEGKFKSFMDSASHVDIAVGYISEKSLDFLADYIHKKGKPYCNLIIGMHYFDKFTYAQYAAAKETENFFKENNLGSVKLVTSFPYHGKLYSFLNNSGERKSIIGSSNLNNILPHKSVIQYETDFIVNDKGTNGEIHNFIEKLSLVSPELSSPNLTINSFREINNLMDGISGVKKIDLEGKVSQFKSSLLYDKAIDLPIKTFQVAPSSNVNAYFGKGRENKSTQIIRRRPWYEVELIVPKTLTDLPWYPKAGYPEKESIITVITDDGYEFCCKISGTNSKNFRSDGDLKILGKWLKGRLENAGFLKVDEPITDMVLEQYGRKTICLIPSNDEKLWYLDFSTKRI